MYEYNIIIKQKSGKISHNRVLSRYETTPEMIARSEMCWYSAGTIFEINGKAFRKIHVNDSVKGYADLEEV